MLKSALETLEKWLIESLGMSEVTASGTGTLIFFMVAIFIVYIVWRVSRFVLYKLIPKVTAKTETLWDEVIFNDRVIGALALLVPVLTLDCLAPIVFKHLPQALPLVMGGTNIIIVFTVAWIISSVFNSINEILAANPDFIDKPIGSFTQLGKIFIYAIAFLLAISILIDKSPIYLLSGFGAIAAVVMLVFKDSILGFVASVQLSANNMVHVGDWVTVPKYDADGDVLEINLTTIKVQNFDKTITTIPTYAFVSDSFTNWRGMEQSQGRRIKRSILIQISSIQFCNDEMIERFKKIDLVKEYIVERQAEIEAHNAAYNFDGSVMVNGRKLTNIGIFEVYLENYLRANTNIHHDMTTMVRQMSPTSEGLPVQVYAFCIHKEWIKYEKVLTDLFDHILASAHAFDLKIFENPSGSDLQKLI